MAAVFLRPGVPEPEWWGRYPMRRYCTWRRTHCSISSTLSQLLEKQQPILFFQNNHHWKLMMNMLSIIPPNPWWWINPWYTNKPTIHIKKSFCKNLFKSENIGNYSINIYSYKCHSLRSPETVFKPQYIFNGNHRKFDYLLHQEAMMCINNKTRFTFAYSCMPF